ncbi:hypothetical protein, partial [Victivallis vadensis]|uniref:hypothetical protein n=1 Tax=Victivallis vadensis TaxID=172901 RepID=UPI003AF88C90
VPDSPYFLKMHIASSHATGKKNHTGQPCNIHKKGLLLTSRIPLMKERRCRCEKRVQRSMTQKLEKHRTGFSGGDAMAPGKFLLLQLDSGNDKTVPDWM